MSEPQRLPIPDIGEQFARSFFGPLIGVEQDDRSILLRKGEGPPDVTPRCHACNEAQTRWRGPHPTFYRGEDDAHGNPKWHTPHPPVVQRDGADVVLMPAYNEMRSMAAERLYRVADVWRHGPQPMADGRIECWQPALCEPCEANHQRAWLEAVSPKPPEVEDKSNGAKHGWR